MTARPRPTRSQVSSLLYVLGFVVIAAVVATRFLKDGSFWLDEASVAQSFRDYGWSQVFTRLIDSQSFPRPYFVAIKTLQEIFGYHTIVLRFLPFVFSLVATALFLRLFRLRFANAPALFLVAILLNLVPTSWFVYSAFLKQYTLDVLLALIPFCLSDDFYDATLRRGERPARLLLLALPVMTSFTYLIPLLGRIGGWALAAVGGRRFEVKTGSIGILAAGLALALASLWATDLRFTVGQTAVTAFHYDYILFNKPGMVDNLLHRLAIGWYTGRGEFHMAAGVAMPLLRIVEALLVLGLARTLFRSLRTGRPSPDADAAWGSRSAGSLVTIAGLLVASPIMQYPISEGRMTLFLLFHLQMMILEGAALVSTLFARIERPAGLGRRLGLVFSLALALGLAPAAGRNVYTMLTRSPPTNIKPVLPQIAEHADLTLYVTACSFKQVQTLPGGVPSRRVEYLTFEFDPLRDLPAGEEVLLLNVHRARHCRAFVTRSAEVAAESRRLSSERDNVDLLWLRLPEDDGRQRS